MPYLVIYVIHVARILKEIKNDYDERRRNRPSNNATRNNQNNAFSQQVDGDNANQPLMRYQERQDRQSTQDDNEDEINVLEYIQCGICLDPFDKDSNSETMQLSCEQNHVFHSECISVWLAKIGE